MNLQNPISKMKEETDIIFIVNFPHSRYKELPSNIWIFVKNVPHRPRLKIQRNKDERMQIDDAFYMTISDNPSIIGDIGSVLSTKDINYFKDFIIKNKETLLMFWDGDLDKNNLTSRLVF